MKKFIRCISVALLAVLCALAFAGCDKAGSIQKAFEKEGYTVTQTRAEDNDTIKAWLKEEQKEDIGKYGVLTCTKKDGLSSAVVVIYICPSADDVKEALGESAYDAAVEKGIVNGNCYMVLPVGLDVSKIIEIFKNA